MTDQVADVAMVDEMISGEMQVSMGLRGLKEVSSFAREMLSTLNAPKNVAKGTWKDMTLTDLRAKITEEYNELMVEIEILLAGGSLDGCVALINESVDLANTCMMARDVAAIKLVKGLDNV